MIFHVNKDGHIIFPDGRQGQISKLMKDENDCFTLFLLPDDREVKLSAEETTAFLEAAFDAAKFDGFMSDLS